MDDFSPRILPEDPPPNYVLSCQKCELSKQRSRVIWGEGNPAAPVFVVLDNPGAREDKNGESFLCGTRQTLQKVVFDVGLDLNMLYISFILKCRPLRAYDKNKARMICVNYLWEQIASAKPSILMSLGNVAIRSLLANQDADVKQLRGIVHSIQGFRTIISYHPLAVRRRPVLYNHFKDDWMFLVEQLKTNDNSCNTNLYPISVK